MAATSGKVEGGDVVGTIAVLHLNSLSASGHSEQLVAMERLSIKANLWRKLETYPRQIPMTGTWLLSISLPKLCAVCLQWLGSAGYLVNGS